MAAIDFLSYLEAEQYIEHLRARIAELERERDDEREALCRDMCPHCINGEAVRREANGVWYHLRDGEIDYTRGCDAWAVQERRYKQQEAGDDT